ncbi:hypothetical protein AWB79_01266 [Caballeronia hypogeia]|uniref:Uncharacterized protein n=1 Tax=Caballeronia hypogeia TaxID=1777140 RepID=A0A157ZRU2_9BURK|nr:hypothetical protein [Caballeronia hypogeia]SAK48232.1 hypothetical protein AWB79_01266 [Caballeronia hypogeia]
MYFGALVTQTLNDQENATWQRDMEASCVTTTGRWRAFWRGLAKLFA